MRSALFRIDLDSDQEARHHVIGGDHADELHDLLRVIQCPLDALECGVTDFDVTSHLEGELQYRALDRIEDNGIFGYLAKLPQGFDLGGRATPPQRLRGML